MNKLTLRKLTFLLPWFLVISGCGTSAETEAKKEKTESSLQNRSEAQSVAQVSENPTHLIKSGSSLIVLTGNVNSQLDPCGCKPHPLGGLSRKAVYLQELKRKGENPIILDAGDIFFSKSLVSGVESEQEKLKAQTLVSAFNKIGCDGLNIGSKDFAGGEDFLLDLKKSAKFSFISANIIDTKTGKFVFEPYIIVKRGDLSFGIVGVTTSLPAQVEKFQLLDAGEEANKFLSLLKDKTDYQILLLNALPEEQEKIRQQVSSADFVFISKDTRSQIRRPDDDQTWPKFYNLGKLGKYLGILNINVKDADSSLVDITYLKTREQFFSSRLDNFIKRNPDVPLEKLYQDDPQALAQIAEVQKEIKDIQKQISSFINTVELSFTPLTEQVGDDSFILDLVNKTLSESDKLASKTTSAPAVPDQKAVSSIPESPSLK